MKILIAFHTPVNAGYAMAALERTFFDVSSEITDAKNIYFSFKQYSGETVKSLPGNFDNVFELDSKQLSDKKYREDKKKFLKSVKFDLALCFDLQPKGSQVDLLRQTGVKRIVSYWGSTISGINQGLKLALKKMEVSMAFNKPDLFIFESEAMRKYATHGRGIPKKITTVIPTGVDTDKLKPNSNQISDLRVELGIPQCRKIAVYSGHMEERKGVQVLIESFKTLTDVYQNKGWHLVICGNRPGEENRFLEMLKESSAKEYVTFCGYRNDLHTLMPQCDIGVIASTGWDSFPMSALEMASCGLPIIVSNLQGLTETVEHEKTGLLFEPGNQGELAEIINSLTNDEERLLNMSAEARNRIETRYSLGIQKNRLEQALRSIF